MKAIYLSRPGVVTCAGLGIEALWEAVAKADTLGIKARKAISGKEFAAGVADKALLPKGMPHILAMTDAAMGLMEKDIETCLKRYSKDRICVCVGTCDNGSEASFMAHAEYVKNGAFPKDYSLFMQGAAVPASYIAKKCGITGAVLSFATACSSSATALMRGAQLLLSGEADAVVAGGADMASSIALLGFDSLEAVSPVKSNPFSVNRRGITLGDGAAFFVMTREDMDKGQGIKIIGMGESTDAHHITAPDDTGQFAAQSMINALEDAMIDAKDVDYVNLHGTGTRQNDAMEARAMQKVFGEGGVPCSSTKSITGHTLGAAGAVETAVCYAALAFNKSGNIRLPMQSWDGKWDNSLPRLDIVEQGRQYKKPRICMTNTFAFGGANASIIVGVRD